MDGWHIISGDLAYVVDGIVKRCIKIDCNNSMVTAYPYRYSMDSKCWVQDCCSTLAAIRAGIARGTIRIM